MRNFILSLFLFFASACLGNQYEGTFTGIFVGPVNATNLTIIFNPYEYGAVGDGVTDDSAAFVKMINAANLVLGADIWLANNFSPGFFIGGGVSLCLSNRMSIFGGKIATTNQTGLFQFYYNADEIWMHDLVLVGPAYPTNTCFAFQIMQPVLFTHIGPFVGASQFWDCLHCPVIASQGFNDYVIEQCTFSNCPGIDIYIAQSGPGKITGNELGGCQNAPSFYKTNSVAISVGVYNNGVEVAYNNIDDVGVDMVLAGVTGAAINVHDNNCEGCYNTNVINSNMVAFSSFVTNYNSNANQGDSITVFINGANPAAIFCLGCSGKIYNNAIYPNWTSSGMTGIWNYGQNNNPSVWLDVGHNLFSCKINIEDFNTQNSLYASTDSAQVNGFYATVLRHISSPTDAGVWFGPTLAGPGQDTYSITHPIKSVVGGGLGGGSAALYIGGNVGGGNSVQPGVSPNTEKHGAILGPDYASSSPFYPNWVGVMSWDMTASENALHLGSDCVNYGNQSHISAVYFDTWNPSNNTVTSWWQVNTNGDFSSLRTNCLKVPGAQIITGGVTGVFPISGIGNMWVTNGIIMSIH